MHDLTTAIKSISDRICNKWKLQKPRQNSLDRETFSIVSGFGTV